MTEARRSKEWVPETRGNANGVNGVNGYGTGVSPTNGANGYTSAVSRPAPVARLSSKPRVDSPGMGTVDDAFHGLAHGMHGDEDAGMMNNSRVERGSVARTGSGMV
jgi:hypothetical protein